MVQGGPRSSRTVHGQVVQENEAKLSRKGHASVMCGVQGNGEGRGKSRRETAVDESRKEMRQGRKIPGRLRSKQNLPMLLRYVVPQSATRLLRTGMRFCCALVFFYFVSVGYSLPGIALPVRYVFEFLESRRL